MRLVSICLIVLVNCVAVGVAAGDSIVLLPTKDNTLIQQSDPAAQLSNGLGDIFVGRTNQDGQGPATLSIRRGLEDFDIKDNLPAGATVTGVTLAMRDVMGLNGPSTIDLHFALQDWGQGTSFQNGGAGAAATQGDATWLYTSYNQATPALSSKWSTAGGSFDPTISGSATDSLATAGFISWSSDAHPRMLADVQSWLTNPSTNFGWVLIGKESAGQTARRFNSRESTSSPNVPPMLTIQYAAPEPAGIFLAGLSAVCLAIYLAGRTLWFNK